MKQALRGEIDCGRCAGGARCWSDSVAPDAGFIVRRLNRLAAGEILFGQGSAFDAPLMVTSGCVAVSELLPDGTERIVAFRVPGEVVGLESWNSPVHRYGAHAISETTLCRIRWSSKGRLVRDPLLLRALLAKATSQAGEHCMPWAGLPAVERVRAFLADFRRRTDQPLPMTRQQIGQYLGLAEETVVRAIKLAGAPRPT